MSDNLLDAFAAATGCDRVALGELVGDVAVSSGPEPAELVDRIGAWERLIQSAQAAQARDLEAFAGARVVEDRAEGVPDHLHGRTASVEISLALRVSPLSAGYRIHEATRAVVDHPDLLGLVGSGAVSMAGLRRVTDATDVLDPQLRRRVDEELAIDVVRSRWTPGQLGRAAQRRVQAADPEAAARRAASARRRREVRLGEPVDGVAGVFARLRAEEALAVFAVLDRTARGMRRDGDPRSLGDLMADLFVEWITGVRLTTPSTSSPPPTPVPAPAAAPDSAPAESAVSPGSPGSPGSPKSAVSPGEAGMSWRTVDGQEPWTWSPAPPVVPDHDPDPPIDDPAWERWTDHPPEPAHPDPEHAASGPARPPPRRLPVSYEIQVVMSASTLLGCDDAPGLLRGYGSVPAEVIRDLIDTGDTGTGDSDPDHAGARTTLRGLFCDPADGRLVAMDSTARYFTGGLRQFALYRDQDCRLSGGRIVDIDHITDHHHAGPTAAGNGQGLGKRAHTLKDHPGIHASTIPARIVGDGLDQLRAHAPDVVWTMPTGHRYSQPPPPALGPGSRTPSPALPTPDPSSAAECRLARLLDTAA